MTTPVRTTIPKTQKQQNFNEGRKFIHAAKKNMAQTVPQRNRTSQPLSNQPLPPENMYYNTAPRKVTQRVHQLPAVISEDSSDYGNDDRNRFTSHSAYPSSSSQQPLSQRVYQPRVYQPPSTMRSINTTTNNSGTLVPTHNYYSTSGVCGGTDATTRKQKVEDMAKTRRELQDKMKRDAEEYMKKKKEKEQKKKEEYIMRHRFMFPDLFGGHKLGDNNSENFYDNSQPEIDSAAVDPVALIIRQEEARRKMQEEYDTKAQKHAEKMKKAEEAKSAQQAEMAAKMKAEADKYKVGRRNTEAGVDIYTGLDTVTLRTEQEETRRKMQDNYSANSRKHLEKMIRVEEAKDAQQAELAAKRNAEACKHEAGLQKTSDINARTESVVKLSENKATRKTQDHLDKIDVQNNSCISNTTYPIQMEKLEEQEINKDDLEYQKKMDTHHYKYGVLPAVPTLKLRLNSVNNAVKKHVDKELDNNGVDTISKVEETRLSEHVSPVNNKKPVDKEKEFRDEMRRARLKMQEAMNLKIQEFQTKSKKEADLP